MKTLFMSEQERQRLLVEWNETAIDYPKEYCIHQLFEERARETSDAIAVVCGSDSLTYGELNRRANQLAHYLERQGAGPDKSVGIYLEHSVALAVAILGTLKAGAAYVPLDTRHPEDRLTFILQEADACAVVTQESLQGNLSGFSRPAVRLDVDEAILAEQDIANPALRAEPHNLAYILFTSGSTGTPKGVLLTHRNLVSEYHAWEKAYRVGTEVRSFCQVASFSFAVFQADWIRALCSGGKLVLCPLDTVLTPYRLYYTMMHEQVDFIEFVPAILRNLLRYLDETEQLLGFLRLVVVGSDRWYFQEHEALRRYCGPDTRVIHSFGLTETTTDSAYFEHTTAKLAPGNLTPIGRPFPNVQLYVLNADMQPVPVGVVGELYIGGNGVARGFLNDPILTAERFVQNPYRTPEQGPEEARLYRTGDLARYLPDGNVQFLGRMDHQVKVRGFRVELGDIETALRQNSAVKEAVVVAQEDSSGENRLVAYVIPAEQPLAHAAAQELYTLPDGSEVDSLNHVETHQLYQEIFEDRLYLRHGLTISEGDIVFDVGANIGMFSLLAHRICNNIAVYAFEPAPVTNQALAANMALHGVNARILNFGLSDTSKSAAFAFYPRSSGMSSFYPNKEEEKAVLTTIMTNQWGEDAAGTDYLLEHADEWLDERFQAEYFSCHLTTLSHMMREHQVERIDLLKVVVQKSEWDVLEGIDEADWPKIRQLVLEVYDIDNRIDRMTELLRKRGYEVAVQQALFFRGSQVYLMYARRQAGAIGDRKVPLLVQPPISVGELQSFLRDKLPDYMMPGQFVFLPALPLTASGKVDRRALPEAENARPGLDLQFVAPRTQTEVTLAQIWTEILGIDRVGIHDDFFRLGGHSLMAAQVISRVRQAWNIELSLRSFLRIRTVTDLAAEVDRIKETAAAPSAGPAAGIRRADREQFRRQPSGESGGDGGSTGKEG